MIRLSWLSPNSVKLSFGGERGFPFRRTTLEWRVPAQSASAASYHEFMIGAAFGGDRFGFQRHVTDRACAGSNLLELRVQETGIDCTDAYPRNNKFARDKPYER